VARCYVGSTKAGTNLPPVLWKVTTTSTGKLQRNEEEEPKAAQKLQKLVAVETMEIKQSTLWADEEDSDF